MITKTIDCKECGEQFEKRMSDYNRSEKLGKPHFCSLSCSVRNSNKKMSPENRRKCGQRIKVFCGNRYDEYSSFKRFLSKGKASIKKHADNIDIDLKYLKELWDIQKGICPYTGIKMILPKNTMDDLNIHSLKKASLDRIDSSKGYIRGNVEFVCCGVNYAKNSFSKEEMKNFIREIRGQCNIAPDEIGGPARE